MENPAIKNGIYMGITLILSTVLLYFINASLAVGLLNSLVISSIVSIIFMSLAAVGERSKNAGFMNFSEGLKAAFLSIVIGSLINHLFNYVLINFIDPSLIEIIKENALAWIDWAASFAGEEGDEAFEEARELIEEQSFAPTVTDTLTSYLGNLIFPSFVFALIIAAITKKENKSFA